MVTLRDNGGIVILMQFASIVIAIKLAHHNEYIYIYTYILFNMSGAIYDQPVAHDHVIKTLFASTERV